MAIDGLFLYNIQEKLNAYTPCKIGKIQNKDNVLTLSLF